MTKENVLSRALRRLASSNAELESEELQRHGLHGTAGVRRHVGGLVFVGSAVRTPAGSVPRR